MSILKGREFSQEQWDEELKRKWDSIRPGDLVQLSRESNLGCAFALVTEKLEYNQSLVVIPLRRTYILKWFKCEGPPRATIPFKDAYTIYPT